jgi:hypothetical protein
MLRKTPNPRRMQAQERPRSQHNAIRNITGQGFSVTPTGLHRNVGVHALACGDGSSLARSIPHVPAFKKRQIGERERRRERITSTGYFPCPPISSPLSSTEMNGERGRLRAHTKVRTPTGTLRAQKTSACAPSGTATRNRQRACQRKTCGWPTRPAWCTL